MPRPTAENPRTEQVNLRLTQDEADSLDAVAFLYTPDNNRVTWARSVIMAEVEVIKAADPRVDKLIHMRVEAREQAAQQQQSNH